MPQFPHGEPLILHTLQNMKAAASNKNVYRFDPLPEAGKSKGLVLVLDAHSDLVTSSSIPDYFQATISFFFLYQRERARRASEQLV